MYNYQYSFIHQNEADPLWITSLLLHIVTVFLNSNVPPSNESMYPCPVKFCWLFFEPLLHFRFHFLVTGILFAFRLSSLQTHERGLRGKHYLRETVTMWRSRDVIRRGPAAFWCMIYVPVLVIIPVLHKMALLFDSPMWRSRDVIHRGPASFWCMIHVPVLVIIPVLNKMALYFDSSSYLYT